MQANRRVYRLGAVGRLLSTDCCGPDARFIVVETPRKRDPRSQLPGIGGMSVVCLVEGAMGTTLKVLAVTSAVLAAGTSSVMAKSQCAAGYKYYNHACHPVRSSGHGNSASAPARSPGYGNPVTGAVSGMEAGGARGNASAGPVGAVVGGALGTASGAATGTTNMLLGH